MFHWVTAMTASEVLCVQCKGEHFPRVLPKPVITPRPFAIPVASMSDAKKLEENVLLSKVCFVYCVCVCVCVY